MKKREKKITSILLMVLVTTLSIQLYSIQGISTKVKDKLHPVSSSSTQDVFWPSNSSEWNLVTPEEQGLNSSKLSEIFDFIRTNQHDVQSIIVVRNGYLLTYEYLNEYEIYRYIDESKTYFGGLKYRHQFSVTKSLMSLLIGIAIQEGFIDNVSQTIFEFFVDDWEPTFNDGEQKKNITIEHLLTMTSGLGGEGYPVDFEAEHWIDCISLILAEVPLNHTPGTEGGYLYNNEGPTLLSGIITKVTGLNAEDFANQYLFTPLGISEEEYFWENDSKGINFGGSGLKCSPKVQAKLGMLCLNNGSWNGQQIVDLDFIIEATSAQVYDGGKAMYGYLFWMTEESFGGYHAAGAEGQAIYVIPEHNIVVGFTGYGITGNAYETIITDYILQFVEIDQPEDPTISGFNLSMLFLVALGTTVVLIKRRKNRS